MKKVDEVRGTNHQERQPVEAARGDETK